VAGAAAGPGRGSQRNGGAKGTQAQAEADRGDEQANAGRSGAIDGGREAEPDEEAARGDAGAAAAPSATLRSVRGVQ
jgi:hypothetical protein